MSAIMKAALVTLMLDRKCQIESVEPPGEPGGYWWITFECPNKIGTTYKNAASGPTECRALIKCMEAAGVYDIKARLFVAGFMVEHLAQRAGPGFLRRIENGGA